MSAINKSEGWLRVFFFWNLLCVVTFLFLIFFYAFTEVPLVGDDSPIGGGKVLVLVGLNTFWLILCLYLLLREKPYGSKTVQALLGAVVLSNLLWFVVYEVEMIEGWAFVVLCSAWLAYLQFSRRVKAVFRLGKGGRREYVRRAIMTGGLAVLVSLAPMLYWDESDFGEEKKQEEETIRSLRDVIVRKQAAINEKGNYQRKLERLEADLKKASGFLFTGDSEAVSAELLKIVTDRATANGIGITRIDQAVKPERIPKDVVDKDPFLADFLRVKVVAYIKCTPDQLAKLLESLENLDKFAYVERLDVKSFSVAPDKTVNGVLYLSTYIFKPEKKETDTKKKETRV
ncbi:MAG: hypothetical protein KA419_10640 [Acidobacteria bacterium]|nr:hypothetical protein [Acidobacteriota bacterium]